MRALLPDAALYSFEPQADTFRAITASLGASPRLVGLSPAVSDRSIETAFHRSVFVQSSTGLPMTELNKEGFPWADKNVITTEPISTLDALFVTIDIQDEILVKIDVQGLEDGVLKGGLDTIRRARVFLIETAYEPLNDG